MGIITTVSFNLSECCGCSAGTGTGSGTGTVAGNDDDQIQMIKERVGVL